MADLTYDAVIVGGGTKALMTALYLMKYGGMSVGIFERRHEIGGCLATEEIAAPGFRGNTHANIILPWYYAPVWRDFPEFWDYGAQWDQHKCSDGFIFADKDNCLAIYSDKYDPTQEKTCREIARFSEKDADTWAKIWEMEQSEELRNMTMDMLFRPPEEQGLPEVLERQALVFPYLINAGLEVDSVFLTANCYQVAREWFESPELQSCALRFAVSSVIDITQPGNGMMMTGMAATLPTIGFNRGGTHMVAHAAHQLLTQMGCEFHINKHVDKAIIENGTAKGIRLSDGTEIKANKLVLSTLSPEQLIFDLIGEEHIADARLKKRVKLIENTFGCLMWYSFAVHEAPVYKAEAFNPDIHETNWLGLQPDPDPIHIVRECQYAQSQQFPPFEDYASAVGCHSLVDPSFAPPGKHVVCHEQLAPPLTRYTEKEWLDIRETYADELIQLWQEYAPNMTWDNVIGVDCNSPYDHSRMKNLLPNGTMAGIDRVPHQINENRPTPALANYRTPINNLYCTGGCWHVGSNAGSAEGYNCYKSIAKDMNLSKPWEEPGKEEPYSLTEQYQKVRKRVQDSLKKD
jgi:beta-carotene ketolase (CrtO type)